MQCSRFHIIIFLLYRVPQLFRVIFKINNKEGSWLLHSIIVVWIGNGSTDFTGRRLGMNQNKKTKSKLKSNHYSHFQTVSEAWLHIYSVLHKYFLQILRICTSWIFHWCFHGPSYRCTAVILPRCCYDVANEGEIYPSNYTCIIPEQKLIEKNPSQNSVP